MALLAPACVPAKPVAEPSVIVIGVVAGGGTSATAADSAADDGETWEAREEVDVEWHGSWWPAVVVEKRGRRRWLVRYDGYGSEWDEVVGPDRVRERHLEIPSDPAEAKGDEPDP
jgi:hypothetical protein